jgi:type II restriction/modification system DNA methylase subunit YeeA
VGGNPSSNRLIRAGLLATQGIRGGANRACLDRIAESGGIFFAVADRDWVLDGATVHVSMVGFDDASEKVKALDGTVVDSIHSDLKAGDGADVTKAQVLAENANLCFLGVMKAGAFDIDEATALQWLRLPNPHGKPNSDVLRPRLTARDILQRAEIGWIIDFGNDSTAEEMAFYDAPWQHVEAHVKPERLKNRRQRMADRWWLHGEARPGLRRASAGLARFIVTPEVSKHRVFSWLDDVYLADHQTRAFTDGTDAFFGIVHSRIHELWARAKGTRLREVESGFRYTPTTCFETFPFPEPTDAQREAIASAAKELDQLRNNWLNPPEWTRTEILEFSGSVEGPWKRYVTNANLVGIGTVKYPRLVPKDAASATQLKNRTLTKLYNDRPTWLANAHKKLDEAVFAAYGWPSSLTDDELLAKLLELNLARAAKQ